MSDPAHMAELNAHPRAKRAVLLRAMPELKAELAGVVNAFDPWARSRGKYYSIKWEARPDAKTDSAFGRRK